MTGRAAREVGRFLSVADAADLLAVDVPVVDGLIRSGELPAIRVGQSGPWRIERTQLELWIQDRYEDARRGSIWDEGEFSALLDLSPAGSVTRLRPVD
ncbi:helix-turn-helix domain-containing protein [Agromyces sp. LHK192]|uniref:helix-turn-helix domain-containing protein n=1 Tax=Agromyces sp. LHK192 TaxID=2498704 RepID=UPI000FDC6B66|nr:helix-turn-helix domain-containing protein [Agromyces sp. LHK192]